jgi:hypothetical protein
VVGLDLVVVNNLNFGTWKESKFVDGAYSLRTLCSISLDVRRLMRGQGRSSCLGRRFQVRMRHWGAGGVVDSWRLSNALGNNLETFLGKFFSDGIPGWAGPMDAWVRGCGAGAVQTAACGLGGRAVSEVIGCAVIGGTVIGRAVVGPCTAG